MAAAAAVRAVAARRAGGSRALVGAFVGAFEGAFEGAFAGTVRHMATRPALATARLAAVRVAASSPTAAAAAGRAAESTLVSAGDIREGDLIEEEGGKLWRVMSRQFSRTAMGRAYVQAELRSIADGTKRDVRYRTEDTLAKASLDTPARYTVLYADGDMLACMHQHTFEQMEMPVAMLGDAARYVQEGMVLTVEAYKGTPAIVNIPPRISVVVRHMDEGGGTAVVDTAVGTDAAGAGISNTFKVRVPKFIKVGDVLTLDTADGKYVGRE